MLDGGYWGRRLRRRPLLKTGAGLAAGAASLALVGCGGDDEDADETATPGPTAESSATASQPTATADTSTADEEGVLRLRQATIFSSINPWKGLDSGLLWGFSIFDHLFYTPFDTLKPELFLATSIEQPEPTTIVFTLGESVFHDKEPTNGRPVTAQDVAASYETSRKQPSVSQTSFYTAVYKGMSAPDEHTVVCELNDVDAWAFTTAALSSPINGSIVPEQVAAEPSLMDQDLVGSGRFQFVSHDNGTNFRIERFDDWRVPGEPLLKGIQYKLIQEQAAALAAFSAQEIDQLALNNSLEREQLVQQHGDEVVITGDLSRSVWIIQGRADGKWADPRLREAINLGIDRQEYIDLMAIGDGVRSGYVPPSFGPVQPTEDEWEQGLWRFDPEEGKRILAEAGFDTSEELEIKYIVAGDNFAKQAQIFKSQLEKNLGLKAKIVGEEFGQWLGVSLYGSNFKDFILYPSIALEEPFSYLGVFQKDQGGRENWSRFFDDELDAAITASRTILDDEARFAALRDIQRLAMTKAAPIFPTHVAQTNTATWNYVKGRVLGRGSFGLFSGTTFIEKD